MAKTLSVSMVSRQAVARQPVNFTVTVTNGDATAAVLQSLTVSETSKTGAIISQPGFLTPNAPAGTLPTLNAGASLTAGFQLVFGSPPSPGQTPNPVPMGGGGSSASNPAFPTSGVANFLVTGVTSDGSVFTTTFQVGVLSATAPFPPPEAGAAQFGQGGCSNLIAAIL